MHELECVHQNISAGNVLSWIEGSSSDVLKHALTDLEYTIELSNKSLAHDRTASPFFMTCEVLAHRYIFLQRDVTKNVVKDIRCFVGLYQVAGDVPVEMVLFRISRQ